MFNYTEGYLRRRRFLRLSGTALAAAPLVAMFPKKGVAASTPEARKKKFWKPIRMDVLTAIHARRSYRDFTGEPVSREDLQEILSCAMAAPSSNGSQPWEFVVLTKTESLKKIPQSIPLTGYATKAGAAILVCVDNRERAGSHLALISTALCVQNMMLAATGLGYGSVWIEIYPNEEYITAWRALAQLPDHVTPLCLLVIGRPAHDLSPVNHMDSSKIHYESW